MLVIGIDQSYENTGISVCIDGKVKSVRSTNFGKATTKTEKRNKLRALVCKYCEQALKIEPDPKNILIVCERVRTVTSTKFVRPDYLKATAALIAAIVDAAFDYGITVKSVDTRCWKSRVVGTSKTSAVAMEGVSDPHKIETILYVIRIGLEDKIAIPDWKRNNGKGKKYNDDAADSICISLVYFKLTESLRKQMLKIET